MTAIAGLWRFDGGPPGEGVERMLSALAMYGPDARASTSFAPIALGRDLMRVLPEDRFDRQPLTGGDGRLALVADVRLDNREELAGKLGLETARLRTLSDADVLLAALERWDLDATDHLLGPFAFAFWDAERARLALVRDPLGERPLFTHRAAGFFAFASMAKGLHALPEVPYAADEERLIEELALMPDVGPRSFYQDIERIEPGRVTIVTAAGTQARTYWAPSVKPLRLKRPEDYQEALREAFDRAVAPRLRGAGDLGAQLSGGLDSSSVTATAARLLAGTDRRLVAFTGAPRLGYDVPDRAHTFGDESAHAAAVAALYSNIEHVVVRTERASILADLERLTILHDRPARALPNQRWILAILDAAKARRLGVLLTGDIGNMTISYNGLQLLNELFRSGRWLRLAREAAALKRTGQRSWLSVAAQVAGPLTPGPLWRRLIRGRATSAEGLGTYTALPAAIVESESLVRKARERALDPHYRPRTDAVQARLWVIARGDPGSGRKGVLAGWRIDCRDPTADRRLIEFCLSVPTEQYLRGGRTAALLRGAFADRLPPMVLEERRSGRQAADWHEGVEAALPDLQEELRRQAACDSASRLIDLPRLQAAVENWPQGGWRRRDVEATYQFALMRGVSAGYFMRRVAGGNG